MELELGLKITKAMDDLVSMSDFRIAKDRAGSVFLSRENDDMFVLTAHLKGPFFSPSQKLFICVAWFRDVSI